MNQIHPTAQVGAHVRLGRGNTIGAFAVLTGDIEIGDDNWIGAGVILGAPPEVRSFPHPDAPDASYGAGLRIGSRNVIREQAQIHGGWKQRTTVGDDAFIMNQVYVGHDGAIEDGATLASSVLLGGHVRIGAGANVGLGANVHQFRVVGAGSMVGMGSIVTRDIPPFATAYGSPARVHGANRVGMERRGIAGDVIGAVHAAYVDGVETDLARFDLPEQVQLMLRHA